MANNEFLGPVADVIGFTCIKMSLVLETFCIQNGISQPFELIAIRAGRNSAVYRVSCLRDQLILKHYFSHDADKRNRLFYEYQFLGVSFFLIVAGEITLFFLLYEYCLRPFLEFD
jgi:hypothetical protein